MSHKTKGNGEMKLNPTLPLKTLDGVPMKDDQGGLLTLGKALSGALISQAAMDNNMTPDQAHERYSLAMDLHNAKKEVTLKSEQITMCKDLVVKVYTPIISGQVIGILEG
jgi:hypothetical protein